MATKIACLPILFMYESENESLEQKITWTANFTKNGASMKNIGAFNMG